MTEERHRRLHHRDLVAAAALSKFMDRPNDAAMVVGEAGLIAVPRQAVELERGLGPEAGQRRRESLGADREVRRDEVVADAGEPHQTLRAETLHDVLPKALEEAHVAAAVLEADEGGDGAREPLHLFRAEDL